MRKTHSVGIKIIFFSIHSGALVAFLPKSQIPERALGEGYTLEDEVAVLTRKHIALSPKDGFVEQLYTISDPGETYSVTVVYYMLVPWYMLSSRAESEWVPLFDTRTSRISNQMLLYAVQRLQWKIEYTNIVYSLLPLKFTLGELQKVYEAILNKQLDKRNFRKKILTLRMIRDTGEKRSAGRARPAEVFTFTKRKPAIVEIL